MTTYWIIRQSDAFSRPVHELLSNRDEEIWDFGQLLPMLLLILPIISAIELYYETVRVIENNHQTEAFPLERPSTCSSFEPNPKHVYI
ncbi:hypothetical protein EPUL_006232 [Erysiphe pulchra]|uniref:Uncharacterized protein n=1 Tax=Erysiphe pulchra TaxID=225359 RepID=A0A2S4PST2_9PEZI|nr:hypothetical protein EPUL_006232 [Erysiphe pulchra]